jgi:transcriptional regulator with XRE-family HTH domain
MKDPQAYEAIGERVKAARRESGMSQGELGAELGVTFQQIQKYEKGKNRIPADRLVVVASIFGKPLSFFLGEEGSNGTVTNPDALYTQLFASKDGLALVKAFVAAKPDTQQMMRYACEGLARVRADAS